MEAELVEAVWGLKGGRSGGASGMSAEDLKGWMREETRTKAPVRRSWELLVRLVQRKLGEGNPPEDLACATMVLILQGRGDFLGIGVFKVACKVCATVVNCRLRWGVVLHKAFHIVHGGRQGPRGLDTYLAVVQAGEGGTCPIDHG